MPTFLKSIEDEGVLFPETLTILLCHASRRALPLFEFEENRGRGRDVCPDLSLRPPGREASW